MRPLPFNIKVHFDFFILLIYAVDKEKAEALLPKPLIHETHNGKAIMAVAFANARNFRPSFFPKLFGLSFNFAGFRHMAEYKRTSGKTVRGLKIIRSLSNRKMMVKGGDEPSQYKFAFDPFTIEEKNRMITVKGKTLDITIRESSEKNETPLPEGSVFNNWPEARKFGGPLLYTFDISGDKISLTEGSRKYWQPVPAEVIKAETDFFDHSPYHDLHPVLSGAYVIRDIPYGWSKAVTEKI